jgi:hypothetical protein
MASSSLRVARFERSPTYVVLGGRILIAELLEREGRSITANLYRNSLEFVRDEAMERQVQLDLRSPQPSHRGCLTCDCPGLSADAA